MTFSSSQSPNTNQLPISLDIQPEEREFGNIVLLYLRRVASAVNTKESGLFLLQETAHFEQWFQISNPQQNRSAYRTTADLVLLNGGPIPIGVTILTLTSSTQPPNINGYLYPVQGFGGAIATDGTNFFLNDPFVFIRYYPSTNQIAINNDSTLSLTWCVWVMEYLKN